MSDLIRRSDAMDALKTIGIAAIAGYSKIRTIPAVDAVERSAFEQVAWERDIAIKQLADIGKSLGEKMDDVAKVVRCRECAVPHNEKTGCPKLLGVVTAPGFFCGFGVRGDNYDK